MKEARFLRRKQAGEYLKNTYGFGTPAVLLKLAVVGGGPEFHRAGRACIYERAALDRWAESKIGPALRSTSDVEPATE